MIIGMPASTFFATLIWPFVYMAAAIVVYQIMKKQDAQIDDTEFEQSLVGRAAKAQHEEGGGDK